MTSDAGQILALATFGPLAASMDLNLILVLSGTGILAAAVVQFGCFSVLEKRVLPPQVSRSSLFCNHGNMVNMLTMVNKVKLTINMVTMVTKCWRRTGGCEDPFLSVTVQCVHYCTLHLIYSLVTGLRDPLHCINIQYYIVHTPSFI